MNILLLIGHKCRAAVGGLRVVLTAVLVLALCFITVNTVAGLQQPGTVRLAVVDEDNTPASAELLAQLEAMEGLTPVLTEAVQAQRLLRDGDAEGCLMIPVGFSAALAGGETPQLQYTAASGAASSGAVRESVAGVVSEMVAWQRAVQESGAVTAEELARLRTLYEQAQGVGGTLCQTTVVGQSNTPQWLFSGGYARAGGIAALAVMLCMFSLTSFLNATETLAVNRRMRACRHGALLTYCTDAGMLLACGLAVVCLYCVCGAGFELRQLVSFAAYCLCLGGLCMLVASLGMAGRADILAPLLVLALGLLGGCFFDIGSVSPALRAVSQYTPPGLLLTGLQQAGFVPAAKLGASGLLLLGAGFLVRRTA